MTRDTQRLHEPDISNDAETYAALWDLSPFPRLPDHAPAEIKSLTVDIYDPKRVYAIHRAARRQRFHLLVERYIIQIRYGCQSDTCTTTTCFSCRRRLAGNAPVRRYNATSARTLAVFLASQDNPEQGLCRNTHAERPGPTRRISKSKRATIGEVKVIENSQDGLTMHGDTGTLPKTIVAHRRSSLQSLDKKSMDAEKTGRKLEDRDDLIRSRVQVLDEHTKMDHKSFVQNVFGTVAFKMVEWLTPSNLQRLSSPDITTPAKSTSKSPSSRNPGRPLAKLQQNDPQKQEEEMKSIEKDSDSQASQKDKQDGNVELAKTQQIPPRIKNKPKVQTAQPIDSLSNSTTDDKIVPKRKSSHVRTSSEPLEHHKPKSILNLSQKPPEVDPCHFAQIKSPRQKVVRQAVLTSPSIRVAESLSPTESQTKIPVVVTDPGPKTVTAENTQKSDGTTNENIQHKRDQRNTRHNKPQPKPPRKQREPPQSLSFLSIDAIQILCQIMQLAGTSEKHTLHPQIISEGLISDLTIGGAIMSQSGGLPLLDLGSQNIRLQWQQFVEQGLFDVLSHPLPLVQSFRPEHKFLDTQTIWFLMLRMTRVAPSLLFDSLWRASKSLFETPELSGNSYEWSQKLIDKTSISLSNTDAAQIISLCLHALVASVPLLSDARKLANMSRIRSYGLSTLGRDSTSLEPVALCLQYDDAFTNEHAIRLARRLFASIPTRRAFAELVNLHRDIQDTHVPGPDILDAILTSLKLDTELIPAPSTTVTHLRFSSKENELHEHRMYILILDWARTVMLQEWQGSAVVPRDGPFGGALMTIAAMYKNRKSLLLGDIHFQTQYFSSRLDPVTMPREWTTFVPNKRTVHLLDYPYLFAPATLVTYFRAINFSNMNLAYETAKATYGMMNTAKAGNYQLVDHVSWEKLVRTMNTATMQFLMLDIRRTDVLTDTFNSIWRREKRELMRPLKLRLGEDGGEEGLDSGGVQQEFFGLAIAEALNPDYGTFTVDERTKMTWFQPGSPEPLWKFELIGTIVSLAVYNGLTLPVTFPKALYRKLLDQEVNELHHIEDGWPDLASGLTTLLEWNESDGTVEDIFSRTYEFSISQFGQTISREMGTSSTWPQFSSTPNTNPSSSNPSDAPPVTNENKNNYISDYIRWLTDISIAPQFEAFKRGFFTCFLPSTLQLFDPSTLQSVIEGIQEIDITELRRITRYVGWDASHHTIRDFWAVVKRYDLDQKKKLLEFITASDRVPVGGMKNLQFTVQKNGVDDGHLPTSYTCFGILLLPEFSSREVLREKLGMALENSKGFGFA